MGGHDPVPGRHDPAPLCCARGGAGARRRVRVRRAGSRGPNPRGARDARRPVAHSPGPGHVEPSRPAPVAVPLAGRRTDPGGPGRPGPRAGPNHVRPARRDRRLAVGRRRRFVAAAPARGPAGAVPAAHLSRAGSRPHAGGPGHRPPPGRPCLRGPDRRGRRDAVVLAGPSSHPPHAGGPADRGTSAGARAPRLLPRGPAAVPRVVDRPGRGELHRVEVWPGRLRQLGGRPGAHAIHPVHLGGVRPGR